MRDSMVYQTFCVHKKHQNLRLNRHSEDKNTEIYYKCILHENVYISEKKTGILETNSEI